MICFNYSMYLFWILRNLNKNNYFIVYVCGYWMLYKNILNNNG